MCCCCNGSTTYGWVSAIGVVCSGVRDVDSVFWVQRSVASEQIMTLRPLPTDFVLRYSLSWREAVWAYDQGWIGSKVLTESATRQLASDRHNASVEVELAGLLPLESIRARDLAGEVASKEPPLSDEVIKSKWLYLILRWLFENREQAVDPFALIDELYTAFDYPAEIMPFVRYMPPEDGYDPSKHSQTENYDRKLQHWRDYLIATEKRFGPSLTAGQGRD